MSWGKRRRWVMGIPEGDWELEKVRHPWTDSGWTAPAHDQSAWLTIAETCENCQRRGLRTESWVNAKQHSETVDLFAHGHA